MTPGWEQSLIDRMVCPRCGAKNTPDRQVIHLDPNGMARCAHCRHEDDGRKFLPPGETHQ